MFSIVTYFYTAMKQIGVVSHVLNGVRGAVIHDLSSFVLVFYEGGVLQLWRDDYDSGHQRYRTPVRMDDIGRGTGYCGGSGDDPRLTGNQQCVLCGLSHGQVAGGEKI